jgi:UDP-GlcNAc3NAcA epimerase
MTIYEDSERRYDYTMTRLKFVPRPVEDRGDMSDSSASPGLLSIIGARPEIIQAAPLSSALERGPVREILVHTGQHYDPAMSGSQILDTKLPVPSYDLGVGSRSDAEQLEVGERRILEVIQSERPAAVLVRGDTNATLAGARAAIAAGLPLLHVEAGLRSYRSDMPEERNRIETDRLSDVLFAPTESARSNLLGEGVAGAIHVTGDPLCDMLESWRERIEPAQGEYMLATVHRGYNTEDPDRLGQIMACLGRAGMRVVLPAHPRLRARITEWGIAVPDTVELAEPVLYSEMLALERGAQAIATDSGGVQREAYLWGVPCVTLREETEWIETVQTGWNTLVGVDADAFAAALGKPRPSERPPIFGDGHAAERIAGLISYELGVGEPVGVDAL